jgi:hypothetical protein
VASFPWASRNMRSEPIASAGVILEREPHRDGHEEAGHQQEDVRFHQPVSCGRSTIKKKRQGQRALPASPF